MPVAGQTGFFTGDLLARVKNEDPGTWKVCMESTPCCQCRSRLTGNAVIGDRTICWTCIEKIKKGK
jgi:hypothetical protein